MTGTTIAQAIPIAISPILTRLYTPEDFGIFGLFIAITGILSSIVNGRYELAIMLPQKDSEAINIAALGLLISASVSILCLISILLFNTPLTTLLGNEAIRPWLYVVPVSIFLAGCFNVLNYLNIRLKLYKDISKSSMYKSVAASALQLGIGFIKAGALGLLSGQIISQLISNSKLFKNILAQNLFQYVSWPEMKRLGKRYINFPKYSMWGIFLNSLSQNLLSISISTLYSLATLGQYTLIQRIFGVPTSIMATSFSQVYFQEASEEKKKTGKATQAFSYTFKRLLLIGLPISILLFLFIKPVIAIIFGPQWRSAGIYAQILIPFFFTRFISSALSITLSLFERLKTELFIHTSICTILLSVVIGAKFLTITPSPSLLFLIISIMGTIQYSCYIYVYRQIASK